MRSRALPEPLTLGPVCSRSQASLVLNGENGDQVQLAPAVAGLIVNLPGHVAIGNMVTLAPTGCDADHSTGC